MKLVLMGTNKWVVPMFERLLKEHEIIAVFTRAPKPVGRKKIVTKSPVHIWAESKGLTVYTSIKEYKDFGADYNVVVSYGVILKDEVLAAAPCINIHPSALPKYRGPSPMTTAIYNGDTSSEVCLMQVVAEVDAGDVYMRRTFEIGENDTVDSIESLVARIGSEMLSEYLRTPDKYPPVAQLPPPVAQGATPAPENHPPQSAIASGPGAGAGKPTFTRKWTGDDEIIDWARGAVAIHNQVRSIGGRTVINGVPVKILETATSDQRLEIRKLQPAGKNPMDWKSFVNGLRGAEIKFGK
jgi:methionyl-tRNA formyltransferase